MDIEFKLESLIIQIRKRNSLIMVRTPMVITPLEMLLNPKKGGHRYRHNLFDNKKKIKQFITVYKLKSVYIDYRVQSML